MYLYLSANDPALSTGIPTWTLAGRGPSTARPSSPVPRRAARAPALTSPAQRRRTTSSPQALLPLLRPSRAPLGPPQTRPTPGTSPTAPGPTAPTGAPRNSTFSSTACGPGLARRRRRRRPLPQPRPRSSPPDPQPPPRPAGTQLPQWTWRCAPGPRTALRAWGPTPG